MRPLNLKLLEAARLGRNEARDRALVYLAATLSSAELAALRVDQVDTTGERVVVTVGDRQIHLRPAASRAVQSYLTGLPRGQQTVVLLSRWGIETVFKRLNKKRDRGAVTPRSQASGRTGHA